MKLFSDAVMEPMPTTTEPWQLNGWPPAVPLAVNSVLSNAAGSGGLYWKFARPVLSVVADAVLRVGGCDADVVNTGRVAETETNTPADGAPLEATSTLNM